MVKRNYVLKYAGVLLIITAMVFSTAVTVVGIPPGPDIDIKPGSYPNSINVNSRGKVAVAILTDEDFDAMTVDPETVDFLGASPLRWAVEDVDGDGDIDMVLHFKIQELDFDLLVDEGDEYPYAYLYAETYDGYEIEGKDTVRLIDHLRTLLEMIVTQILQIFESIMQIFG